MRSVISPLRDWFDAVAEALHGPQVFVFALAFVLALIWFGAQMLWLALPFALIATLPRRGGTPRPDRTTTQGQLAEMAGVIVRRLARARKNGPEVPCVFLGIDRFADIRAQHGPDMQARLVTSCLDHLARALRPEDRLFELGAGRFGVLVAANGAFTEDAVQRVAHRLRIAAESSVAATLPRDVPGVRWATVTFPARGQTPLLQAIADTLATLDRASNTPPSCHHAPLSPSLTTRKQRRDGPAP